MDEIKKKQDLSDYLKTLTKEEAMVLKMVQEEDLSSIFFLEKSHGFLEWKKKKRELRKGTTFPLDPSLWPLAT